MDMILIDVNLLEYPPELSYYLAIGDVYDCSCHSGAKTLCIKTEDEEYYLKTAPKDSLRREALMTHWFYEKGLAEDIVTYISLDQDYLLKKGVEGIDLTSREWLEKPEDLCRLYASVLHKIHDLCSEDLPDDPVCTAMVNDGYKDERLKADTVIHGDYCLPNVITKDGEFSGFIDLGQACLGDRHIDIYWALWSLEYNLKTDRFRDLFLNAYGRELLNEEILEVIRKEQEILDREEA